ncbi:MAG: M20 family metallopeptidase [Thermoplasmata archaeon]
MEGEEVRFQKVPGFPPNVLSEKVSSEDAPTVILNGHMDTVEPMSGWRGDPFKPEVKGNMLYGLGASDMKGGLAVLIKVFRKVRNPRINLIFVSTVDEEGESTGAHTFLREYDGEFCLVGEPSCEELVLGARGKAAHGARPYLGTNPIEDMAKVLASLSKVRIRSHRVLGKGSIAPLGIEGGERSLTIPEVCKLRVDRHTVFGETENTVKVDFLRVMKRLRTNSRISVSFIKRRTPFPQPYLVDRRSKYVRRFVRAFESLYRRKPVLSYAESVGDYNFFGLRMPTLVFGPIGKGSHTAKERLDIRSLYRCERVLINFLEKL